MKAITIWQPWASLIMAGAKPWEWRGWPAPRALIGQRIAIHAGARPVRRSEIVKLQLACHDGDTSLVVDEALELLERLPIGSYPLSHALGTAILGSPIQAAVWAAEHDKSGLDSDRVDHSKWAWPLTDIEHFEPPIYCRGAQGFWEFCP